MYVDATSEDFSDFFQDNDDQAVSPARGNLFHQINPQERCRLTWGPGCRDHRCSHHCRARWAFKEATVLRRHLNGLGGDKHVYFGELVVVGEPTAAEHKRFRSKFQKALTALGRDRNGSVKLLATSEVGENLRLHYHHCLVSDFEVRQYTIKKLWAEAVVGWRTIVSHSRPRSTDARARYMFKDMWKYRGNVRLLRKGSPRMTWGHLDFYPQGKTAVWEKFIDELKQLGRGQHEEGQQLDPAAEREGEPPRDEDPGRLEAHDAPHPAVERSADLG